MKKFRKGQLKRIFAAGMSLIISVSFLGGCGNSGQQTVGNGTDGAGSVTADGSGQTSEPADGTAMGRYLEEVTDMSDTLSGYRNGIYRLADGRIVITDPEKHMSVSKDNGITWEQEGNDWLDEIFQDEGFVAEYNVGADGTVGIVYMKMTPDDSGETANNEQDSDGESSKVSSDDDQATGEDSDEGEGAWPDIRYAALVVRTDGMQINVKLPEEDMEPSHIWITDGGRIFLGTDEADLYEVSEDGSCKQYLTLDDSPQIIKFVGNRMIIDGYDFKELLIYDMDQETYVEDDVLADFFHENYKDRSFNGGSFYDLFFFTGEDDVLYLAGKNGLYRHVIGGSAMEQVIDGGLTTFGNPAYKLIGMTKSDNNEFMAIFTNARLVRFVYDPDVPTVPSKKIKAYSLKDNSALRQAISLYQTADPDVYVEYVIGMSENDAVTRDDAVKKLNTEIVAGNGPDLLILDDLPVESYIEKGLLRDLSPVLDSLTGDEALFDNIVDSFRRQDHVYMVPCDINLPVLLGRKQDIAGTENLETFADCVEKIRQEHPEDDIFAVASAKAIMKLLTPVCAPSWVAEDQAVDKEAVAEFFTQTKRIYDAQMDGLSEKAAERWLKDATDYYMTYYGVAPEDYEYFNYGVSELEYMVGYKQLMLGTIGYTYAYAELNSVSKTAGYEDNIWKPLNGQSSNVFYADTLAGINAASQNMPYAEGLFKTLIGADKISGDGFPLNKAAFEKGLYPEDYKSEFESYSSIGFGDGEKALYVDVYWFGKALEGKLRGWMETVDTPYMGNDILEEAVYAAGVEYFEEKINLEEAVAEVEKSMAIYMAE